MTRRSKHSLITKDSTKNIANSESQNDYEFRCQAKVFDEHIKHAFGQYHYHILHEGGI